ncbi:MAG: exodeoxyribonuclease VII small subunit [Candidatus Sumerlaeia bacterium]|nr:exodeoxyribonuclease VII small subunit [Candidatus Sumerlaeia bacterium]
MSETTPKKMSFEKAMARLEEIVQRLESGQASLDETIRLFEEGKRLGQDCRRQLTEVEKKIQKIVEKENGEIALEDFETDEDKP